MSTVSSAITSTATQAAQTLKPAQLFKGVDMPEAFLENNRLVRESIIATFTPLNITIFLLLGTLIYYRFLRPSPEDLILAAQKPITFRTFTPRTLLPYNGKPSKPFNEDGKVYLAVKGKVYDVSSGRNFYGPGGPYENFAGRDATRGLACQSFEEDMLTKNLDGPLDDCKDLGPSELENLQGWVERFDEKYLVVGKLAAFGNINSPFKQ